jgi:hypothetical protein
MSVSTSTAVETVYLGHDNLVTITPYSDYSARINWDMSATTKVIASADLVTSVTTGDDITVNSVDDAALVTFGQVTNDAGDLEWRINMKVGLFTAIVAGAYKIRVIIEDPVNTVGVVIADDLLVTVVDVP